MHYSEKTLKFGRFTFDLNNKLLRSGSQSIHLRPLAAQTLAILLDNHNSVVTHKQLRQQLWGDRIVEWEMGLHRLIQELRTALADDARNPTFIRTLAKRGYSFCAPLEPVISARASVKRGMGRAMWFVGGVLFLPGVVVSLCLYLAITG